MKRKLMMVLCCAFMLGAVTVNTVQAQRSPVNTTNQVENVSDTEKFQVCCKLEADRILDLRTALLYMRTGNLQIGKIGEGHYWAVISGGTAITVLIDDNI